MGILWYGKRLIMKKEFPILYKYTQNGAIQQWQIIVEHDRFHTIEGHKDGKLTTSLPTICIGKNIGKKNQTSPMEQALAEATSKHQKKLDKSYNEVLTSKKNFYEPMLARDAKESKDLPTDKPFPYRTFVQPKLDGLRTINEDNTLTSRNGKPYITCPHLLQNKVTLDGELYSHKYHDDFNEIVSLVKKQKPTKEDIYETAQKVEMWCYDFPSHPGVFSDRYANLGKFLRELDNTSLILVPCYEVFSWDEIRKYHEKFIEEGYEGTIIRLDTVNYESGKRPKQLLKYKDFVDEEFTIIGAEEGTGGRTGTIGFFHMQMSNGKKFKSNIKGNFEYLADIWKNHQLYIGKQATVKYFNLTPEKENGEGGVPRFPYVIKLDRQSYE